MVAREASEPMLADVQPTKIVGIAAEPGSEDWSHDFDFSSEPLPAATASAPTSLLSAQENWGLADSKPNKPEAAASTELDRDAVGCSEQSGGQAGGDEGSIGDGSAG
ncbi:unnamed protein product, partial [Chrysoparadoxa australica]